MALKSTERMNTMEHLVPQEVIASATGPASPWALMPFSAAYDTKSCSALGSDKRCSFDPDQNPKMKKTKDKHEHIEHHMKRFYIQ